MSNAEYICQDEDEVAIMHPYRMETRSGFNARVRALGEKGLYPQPPPYPPLSEFGITKSGIETYWGGQLLSKWLYDLPQCKLTVIHHLVPHVRDEEKIDWVYHQPGAVMRARGDGDNMLANLVGYQRDNNKDTVRQSSIKLTGSVNVFSGLLPCRVDEHSSAT